MPGERLQCRVLIVGGGGAGLRAALAAADVLSPDDVLLATKGELGKSGTTALAYSDRMAFHAALPHTPPGAQEAVRTHAEDIFRIGGEVSDGVLAMTLAEGGAAAFNYLDALGVPFVRREDGLPDQFVTDGSKYPRACYTGPDTAVQIHKALLSEFRKRGLRAVENVSLVELAAEDGRVTGGVFRKEERGELLVAASATVLAAGGPGSIFLHNAFPDGMHGEAHAAALRAGAELVNMEFIQIGICSVKTKLACSGSLMRALPRMVDEEGREFLFDYVDDPQKLLETVFRKGASWPVSAEEPSHIVDVACAEVIGRGGKVFMDFSAPSEAEKGGMSDLERFHREGAPDILELRRPLERLQRINPRSIAWLKERGIDLKAGDKIEVAPSIQHFQGGIRIDERAETTLPGLYAAGECAGGQHGANRPGGNALMDCQVMGRIAGEQAAKASADTKPGEARPSEELGSFAPVADPAMVPFAQEEVRKAVYRAAGVIRRESAVKEAAGKLEALSASRNGFLVASTSLLGRAIAAAILEREESRGPHLRFKEEDGLDLLARDDEKYRKMIVLRFEDGEIRSRFETPRPLPSARQRGDTPQGPADSQPASPSHST